MKWLAAICLIAIGAYLYVDSRPKGFDDKDYVVSELRRINQTLEKNALEKNDLAFVEGLLDKEIIPHKLLIWPLIEGLQKYHDELFVKAANLYSQTNFANHKMAKDAPTLASLGGELLKRDGFALGAQYFEKAFTLGQGSYKKEDLATWAFFSGHGYELASQLENAIQKYKEALNFNENDYRPSRQLGILYFKKLKEDSSDRLALSLSKKYLLMSLKANDKQDDLKSLLAELEKINLKRINQLNKKTNPQVGSALSQIKLPPGMKDPRPYVPGASDLVPSIPGEQVNKKFKVR